MKKLTALIATGTTYLFVTANTYAANLTINPCPEGDVTNDFQILCNLRPSGTLFSSLILIAFIAASLIALAFLVYGGIRWITSGGDKAGVESARNIIVAALVGLVITFLAYFIINIVFDIFGLTFANFELPTISAT